MLFPPSALRPLILTLLVVVAIYTFMRKDFGLHRRTLHDQARVVGRTVAIGSVVGFYDGFFGPGTGSFLVFLFIRLLGMDFLLASVTAKIVNIATNVAASGAVFWKIAAVMAACNLAGSAPTSRCGTAPASYARHSCLS